MKNDVILELLHTATSAFQNAAAKGNIALMEALLAADVAELMQTDADGFTALHRVRRLHTSHTFISVCGMIDVTMRKPLFLEPSGSCC